MDLAGTELSGADVGHEEGEAGIDAGLGLDVEGTGEEETALLRRFEGAALPLERVSLQALDLELIDGIAGLLVLDLVRDLLDVLGVVVVLLKVALLVAGVADDALRRALRLHLDLELQTGVLPP